MKYIIKFRDFIDMDNDAMLVDVDEVTIVGASTVVFIANDVPILYVPISSVMFIKQVGDDLRYLDYDVNPNQMLLN